MVFLDRNWCRSFFGEFCFGSLFLCISSPISCDFHQIWWHFVIKNRLKIDVKFYIDFELDFWWKMSHFGGHFDSLGLSFWHHFLSFSCRSPRETIWEPFERHLGGIWEVFGRHLGGSGTHLGGIWGACRRYLGVFGMILEVFGCYKLKLKLKAKAKAKAKS